MTSKVRTQLRLQRTEELRRMRVENPRFNVLEFSPSHLRIIVERAVDYWPSTGRAWVVGSHERSRQAVDPAGVVALAMQPSLRQRREADEKHQALDAEFRAVMGAL